MIKFSLVLLCGTALATTALAQVGPLDARNNLSDLSNQTNARTNLGLSSLATMSPSAVAQTANNLSDLGSAAAAAANLGLGTASSPAFAGMTVSAGNNVALATAAAQPTTGYQIPLSTTAGLSVGMPVTGTNVPANSHVVAVSGGTATITAVMPFAVGSKVTDIPVSNSTGILNNMVVRDSASLLSLTSGNIATVSGVLGAASAPVTLTSPTAASQSTTVTVASGGAACLAGMLLYDTTTPASTPNGLEVIASAATSITTNLKTAGTIASSDVVNCYPHVQLSVYATGTAGITNGDTLTFYPSVAIENATTTPVASGATLTFAPTTAAVLPSLVGGTAPLASGLAGWQINGNTVFKVTGGLGYINVPYSQTLVGYGAGANLPATDALTTAVGYNALGALASPNSEATALGWGAGHSTQDGSQLTLIGINTLGSCVFGCNNMVAVGTDSFRNATSVSSTVGVGGTTGLTYNGTGSVFIGFGGVGGGPATGWNGNYNVIIGYGSLNNNSTTNPLTSVGSLTAIGANTMANLTSGYNDDAIGYGACAAITSDYSTVCLGYKAGYVTNGGYQNTFVGNLSGYNSALPGATTFVGTINNGTIGTAGTILTVSSVSSGTLAVGTLVSPVGGTPTCITSLSTGTGGTGTYNVNVSENIASATITGAGAVCGHQNVIVGPNAGGNLLTASANTIIGQAVASNTLSTGSFNILIGTGTSVDTVATNTSNEINIGGVLFYNNKSVAAPVVSACGTSPAIDTHANVKSGTVTAGTGTVTSCTITMAAGVYSTWAHCRVTSQAAALTGFGYSYVYSSGNVITLVSTGSMAGDKFDYDCDGV